MCNAGYGTNTNDPDGCDQCVRGKYKDSLENVACTLCDAGKYLDAVGTSQDLCDDCQPGKYSHEGAAQCSDCDR